MVTAGSVKYGYICMYACDGMSVVRVVCLCLSVCQAFAFDYTLNYLYECKLFVEKQRRDYVCNCLHDMYVCMGACVYLKFASVYLQTKNYQHIW